MFTPHYTTYITYTSLHHLHLYIYKYIYFFYYYFLEMKGEGTISLVLFAGISFFLLDFSFIWQYKVCICL
jgi:hypothetical protein